MQKKRYDINLGCGHTVLSFFIGIILLIFALGFFVFWFIPFLLVNL